MEYAKLPWAGLIGNRCRARLASNETPDFFGRCELKKHDPEIPHALERGMVWLRDE